MARALINIDKVGFLNLKIQVGITVKVQMFAGCIFWRVKTSRTHIFMEKICAKIKTNYPKQGYHPRKNFDFCFNFTNFFKKKS